MPSVTTSLLQLIDMATGENENTWGDINDANLLKLESAIANAGAHSSAGGTTTLTNDQSRNAMLVFSGSLSSDHTVVVPARTKMWLVRNNHTLNGFALKFKTASGAAVSVPQGASPVNIVFCDGLDIYVSGVQETSVDAKIQTAARVYGASVSGTANAIVLDTSPEGYMRSAGKMISFIPSADNTGAVTINAESTGAASLLKQTPEGTAALAGGELQAGHEVLIVDDGTNYQLIGDPSRLIGTATDIASDSTVDLGTVLSHVATITGTTTITSFGASASTAAPMYFVRFSGVLTLTNNGASLILPGGANITTAAGDCAIMEYLGTGNWRCRHYQKINGKAIAETDQFPAQAGQAGKLLSTNGSALSWDSNSVVRASASISNATSPTCTVDAAAINIASVTYSGGLYTVTFSNALASTNYRVFVTLTGAGSFTDTQFDTFTKSTTGFTFKCVRPSNGTASAVTAFDLEVKGGWS